MTPGLAMGGALQMTPGPATGGALMTLGPAMEGALITPGPAMGGALMTPGPAMEGAPRKQRICKYRCHIPQLPLLNQVYIPSPLVFGFGHK